MEPEEATDMNELILVIVALPLIAAVLASLVQEKSAKSIAILGSAIACLVSESVEHVAGPRFKGVRKSASYVAKCNGSICPESRLGCTCEYGCEQLDVLFGKF